MSWLIKSLCENEPCCLATVLAFFRRRLPRFSKNFTSPVEMGPSLAFESHEFRHNDAFLLDHMVPVLIVSAIASPPALAVALRSATPQFFVTRLAGLNSVIDVIVSPISCGSRIKLDRPRWRLKGGTTSPPVFVTREGRHEPPGQRRNGHPLR